MTDSPAIVLRGGGQSLVIAAASGERPHIVHWGADLDGTAPEELIALAESEPARGAANVHVKHTLSNEPGTGIGGAPGLVFHRERKAWAPDLRVLAVRMDGENSGEITCGDKASQVEVTYRLALDPASGTLSASTQLTNIGGGPLSLEWCAAPVLPLDRRYTHATGFSGRWSAEFQRETVELFRGTYLRENRSGRTSHDCYPALMTHQATAGEEAGLAAAFHLAWSGNSRMRVDTIADGRSFLLMGELLLPGEIELASGESYATPELVARTSKAGFGELSRSLHDFIRDRVLNGRTRNRPRPVHFNTWEAVYFAHDEQRLMDLAQQAAAVGAERFVLDDGWFGARRNDAAGLGDWTVSSDIYPNGLKPLADHVRSLGMQFGLWFEPEMVNPDSDLFRAHPDWVLGMEGAANLPYRNQLTLDLTRGEVSDYLYNAIEAVVADAGAQYIKWDMNRDTVHPGSDGRAAMHRQTQAVYTLMQRLRERFPELEIESCSSGGARADYGVLRHTDRVWTSDNNDALDRQTIQRNASHFLPLSITGSHVGPRKCHISGRVLSMAFRAGTAIFGHMGMELDLAQESDADRATLARAIALHKRHRALIHGGDFHRLELEAPFNGVAVAAKDGAQALVSVALLETQPTSGSPRLYLPFLAAKSRYRLRPVWPDPPRFSGPGGALGSDTITTEGLVASGDALAQFGLQLPSMNPATCLIFHLERI